MVTRPLSSGSSAVPSELGANTAGSAVPQRHHRMSAGHRLLFFLTAWLIVLMPFLFWWSTWFGRQLSPQKIGEYLKDDRHPRHIQHALVQIGERLGRGDVTAASWNDELIRLASHRVEEVRNTDAWVMGQARSFPGFHGALLTMLQDAALTVRGNAALSLVRFGDATGRAQIVALLQPAKIIAAHSGRVIDADKAGTSIRQGGLIAKIEDPQHITEVRSPIAGRIRSISVNLGASVSLGSEIAVVDPAADQVWEALRALYLVGRSEDLDSVRAWERDLPEISDRLRQQALLTDQAIRERARQ
jgi:hypothetical protein